MNDFLPFTNPDGSLMFPEILEGNVNNSEHKNDLVSQTISLEQLCKDLSISTATG